MDQQPYAELREVGFCYLHNDPTIRPEAHLFSVPCAVKDGLLVSFSPSAKSMIVTHLDGYITVFKLLDGLYRTTLNSMHRPKSFFSTDSEVNDHSVSIMTRSMSRSAAAPISNNRVAENVADNNADSNNAEKVADNNANSNTAENDAENAHCRRTFMF